MFLNILESKLSIYDLFNYVHSIVFILTKGTQTKTGIYE